MLIKKSARRQALLAMAAVTLFACVMGPQAITARGDKGLGVATRLTQTHPPRSTITVRGRVLLPASLVSDAAGGLISNNAGGLIANNAGSLISDASGSLVSDSAGSLVSNNSSGIVGKGAGAFRIRQTAPADGGPLDEQPVTRMRVFLADAGGRAYDGLASVITDATGQFTMPEVPGGLTYTVTAVVTTPKGDIRVSALAAAEDSVTIGLASTLVVRALKREGQTLWGRLDGAAFGRVVAAVTGQLTSVDRRLAFGAVLEKEADATWKNLAARLPEIGTDWQGLSQALQQVPKDAVAIAEELRARPPVPSPATPSPVSITPAPTATPAPAMTPTPSALPSPGAPITYTISTLAGTNLSYADGAGTVARFSFPDGLTIDRTGTLYVVDSGNNRIRLVTPQGVVSTLEGSSRIFVGDENPLGSPRTLGELVKDAAGNLYVTSQERIMKISPDGVTTTFAGSTRGFADGQGSAAQFSAPNGLALDAAGNLYVADTGNFRIRKITPQGLVSTLAGGSMGAADGLGSAAQFNGIKGMALDASGNLYVTDASNHRIRKITPQGLVGTLAGSTPGDRDGDGTAAQFQQPVGMAIDAAGNLYVTEAINHRIRKVTPEGVVTTIAGSGEGFANGMGNAAQFQSPAAIVIDSAGNLYVSDSLNHCIRKITPQGLVTTLAGSPATHADGSGLLALLHYPAGITIDATGNLYLADVQNHRIRKVTPQGNVSTLAGSIRGSADGTGSAAQFSEPEGVAVDAAGNLYVADTWNHRIRKVTPQGVVTTLAGGNPGFGDATGTAAQFNEPRSLVVDATGTLYVADYGNRRIRKVTPAGVVTTFAGGQEGNADGLGTQARFGNPDGLAIDATGNLYVSDSGNQSIRKVTPAGLVTTLAGGQEGSADGTGSQAQFKEPSGLAIDAYGYLYIADSGNHRIRRLSPQGVVTTVAGSIVGQKDGTDTSALFSSPLGLAVDATGTLYVTDMGNHAVRKVSVR